MESSLVRTIFSLWSWFVFGVLLIIWVPLVGIVRLVTAPFDKGRYAAGFLFRKFAVVHQMLNPLWHFDVVGQPRPTPAGRTWWWPTTRASSTSSSSHTCRSR